MVDIAIIGAGIAGLTLAHKLKNVAKVRVFEKAQTVGGRMRSRQYGDFSFDHGTQFFTVRTKHFSDFLRPLKDEGVVDIWRGRFVEFHGNQIHSRRIWDNDPIHYVGSPNMHAIGYHLAKGLDIFLDNAIVQLKWDGKWFLVDSNGQEQGPFDWVISTVPSPLTRSLLPASFPYLSSIDACQMSSCYSLMLGFREPLPLNFDAALIKGKDISWLSVNASKPGREGGYTILVHSTNKWSDAHPKDDDQAVMDYLCAQVQEVIGHDVINADCMQLKHWPHANMKKRQGEKYYLDRNRCLAACGDWCIQGRVEAAFLSAYYLAEALCQADLKTL